MSTEIHTLDPADSLADAQLLMKTRNIRHIPVVGSDGQLVGLVTQSDVLAAMESVLSPLSEADRLDRESSITVQDFMSTSVETVDARADIRAAALELEKHKLGCLPVVTDGKLSGIVTDTDFVGVAINLLEQLEATEPTEDT